MCIHTTEQSEPVMAIGSDGCVLNPTGVKCVPLDLKWQDAELHGVVRHSIRGHFRGTEMQLWM